MSFILKNNDYLHLTRRGDTCLGWMAAFSKYINARTKKLLTAQDLYDSFQKWKRSDSLGFSPEISQLEKQIITAILNHNELTDTPEARQVIKFFRRFDNWPIKAVFDTRPSNPDSVDCHEDNDGVQTDETESQVGASAGADRPGNRRRRTERHITGARTGIRPFESAAIPTDLAFENGNCPLRAYWQGVGLMPKSLGPNARTANQSQGSMHGMTLEQYWETAGLELKRKAERGQPDKSESEDLPDHVREAIQQLKAMGDANPVSGRFTAGYIEPP